MQIGNIRSINIDAEMRESYLDYAMSVIVARALPDVRDGLKPVQRRILYAMHDLGLSADKPHRKSARIVGEVLGKYHPHGEMAVYDAMVRMAQDFSMRQPLVDGQGNFGSVDGDSPAAQRYTEARMAPITQTMLADIDKNTVDFVDNFDGSLREPSVLPAAMPNLLVNGASGIAVGMATNIPPHNLPEVCDAISYLIDNYENMDDVSVEDLMQFVRGPDFPTAALIMGREGISTAYATGKGRVIMRAATEIEEVSGGRYAIIVTEIPYQLNKSALLEKIAELVRNGRLDTIADLRDESDREGLRIVILLKRGANPTKVLNQLFKWTPLQSAFSINMLALVDGQPRSLSLKRMLQLYIKHRQEIIARRSRFELDRTNRRAHILEGLLRALDDIDAVIDTIRSSPDADTALQRLMERFNLTEEQSRSILDMQLRRLASLERERLLNEYAQLKTEIERLQTLLASPKLVLTTIKEEIEKIKETYGNERRTRIINESAEPFGAEDLIMDEPVLVSITRRGYIKRLPSKTYRVQGRGGKGVTGAQTSEEDDVEHFFASSNLSNVFFFTNKGRVFVRMAHTIPDTSRTAKGIAVINLLPLEDGERVTAAVSVPRDSRNGYLCMVTRYGRLKRVPLAEFSSVRVTGIRAVTLEEDDELTAVKLTSGSNELIMVSTSGRALCFNEKDAPIQGRTARGVLSLSVPEGEEVAGLEVVEEGGFLLVVTEHGYGKRVPLSEYSARSRRGKGVITLRESSLDKTGRIVSPRVIAEDDEVSIMTCNGMAMRVRAADIPSMGRYAAGSIVMRLNEGDTVASVARLQQPDQQ